MIPYKERTTKLKPPKEFGGTPYPNIQTCDRWYSYLINDWIPNQPDFSELMKLFVECDFDPMPFVKKLVVGPPSPEGNTNG